MVSRGGPTDKVSVEQVLKARQNIAGVKVGGSLVWWRKYLGVAGGGAGSEGEEEK